MKRLLFLLLTCISLLLTACGQGTQPQTAEMDGWTLTDGWPDNEWTQQIPEPKAGQVYATTQGRSAGYDFYVIQLNGLTRQEIGDYIQSLEDQDYGSISDRAGLDLSSSGVAVGELFSRDDIYVSLSSSDQETDNTLGLYLARPEEQ